MKKLSLFQLGSLLSVIAVVWLAYSFSEAEKTFQSFTIEAQQSVDMEIELKDSGIGFYQTYMPNFDRNEVFIQILGPADSILVDKKIQTKLAVNYFDFKKGGEYTIKLTNLSNNQLNIEIEFGDSNESELQNPGIILLVGMSIVFIASYRKLKNYKMAQPDEKIS